MIAIIALLFQIVGTAFLVVATVGVLRFDDPFQRMHAATKAGTVGAGLVLVGVMIAMQSTGSTVIGLLTLIFLIGTVPVTGHLLGRASYVSGAPLRSHEDALEGVLPRAASPLEERIAFGYVAPAPASATLEQPAKAARVAEAAEEPVAPVAPGAAAELPAEAGYTGVRYALIAPHARNVTRRAMKLAADRGVTLTAVAVIDRDCVENARIPQPREAIRTKLALAIEEMRAELGGSPSSFSLSYEEGDPLALIPAADARELLLLPTDGWCHHGARLSLPSVEERQVEKLFEVARKHAGPTIFVGDGEAGGERLVVMHDGSSALQERAAWALNTGLWKVTSVVVVGEADAARIDELAAIAAGRGLAFTRSRETPAPGALLPAGLADAAALVLPRLPEAGADWFAKVAPGWRGEVLV